MTGGDTMVARFMRAEWFEFPMTAKVVLATNHRPEIRGTDDAIWRRIRLVPFTVTIPPDERDPQLVTILRAEKSGILNWAIAGCLDWQRDGLSAPEAVNTATAEYRTEMDKLGAFLEDRCILTDTVRPRPATSTAPTEPGPTRTANATS
jgi:putative DNA primase/helicase